MGRILSELEPFHRGWYGAPIGYISRETADICVAIRSALVSNSHIELFAGTGITHRSCPLKEWEELEQKITLFKEMFQ
ncbi:MAG: chorismate-binding protein [Chlamydiales bacterium]|nr:chorismate-binding protein [Chlamydiales bacterium]